MSSGYLAALGTLLLARGLETWAPVGEVALAACLGPGLPAGQAPGSGIAKGAVAVALPYDPRPGQRLVDEDSSGGPGPYLRVGAFASAHRYAALARLLKTVARDLAAVTGQPYSSFRVSVNSRLPEKQLVQLSGLGIRGRSDLLLTHAYGPACILGLLLLPFDPLETITAGNHPGEVPGRSFTNPCDTCQACVDACPGSAILDEAESCTSFGLQGSSRTYHRESCIQYWMSTRNQPPLHLRPAFAGRLYGCDACILTCPLSAGAWQPDRADASSPASRADALLLPEERRPGSLISASFLRTAGDDEMKAFFRKTALGFSWFGPGMFRHNTELATCGCGIVEGTGI
jgi:epoxyqueuosine reductase QueG